MERKPTCVCETTKSLSQSSGVTATRGDRHRGKHVHTIQSFSCPSVLTDSSSASLMLVKAFRIEDRGLDTPIVPIILRIASPSCLTVYFSQFPSTSSRVQSRFHSRRPQQKEKRKDGAQQVTAGTSSAVKSSCKYTYCHGICSELPPGCRQFFNALFSTTERVTYTHDQRKYLIS